MNNNETIIDTNFEEVKEEIVSTEDKNIDIVEPTYYTTKQVAEIIEEPDSTVRYWSRYFEKHLEFIYSNKNRAYTKQDVNRLLQISELKRRGMTLKQIEEYFLANGFQNNNGELDTKNPLAMEVFMESLTANMDQKMETFQKNLTEKVMASMLAMQEMVLASQEKAQESFKNQIAITIDEAVTDKMSEFTGDLKVVVDELGDNVSEKVENSLKNASSEFEKIDKVLESNKELETKLNDFITRDENRDKEIVDKIKVLLDKKETERVEQLKVENDSKGFFSKFFGK